MSQLRNFTKVISKLGGRDKVNKWIQYQAKLLFYILTQMDYDKSTANKFKSLSSGISNARKVDRLLKSSVEVQKALDAFNNNKSDQFAKYLTILSAYCYAIYWWTDNKIFLSRIKVLDNVNVKELVIRGHKYWLLGLLIVMYLFVGKMNKLYQERKELQTNNNNNNNNDNQKAINEIDNNLHLKRIQFIGYCCDVLVALNNAGYIEKIKGSKLSDGIYGLCGLQYI